MHDLCNTFAIIQLLFYFSVPFRILLRMPGVSPNGICHSKMTCFNQSGWGSNVLFSQGHDCWKAWSRQYAKGVTYLWTVWSSANGNAEKNYFFALNYHFPCWSLCPLPFAMHHQGESGSSCANTYRVEDSSKKSLYASSGKTKSNSSASLHTSYATASITFGTQWNSF